MLLTQERVGAEPERWGLAGKEEGGRGGGAGRRVPSVGRERGLHRVGGRRGGGLMRDGFVGGRRGGGLMRDGGRDRLSQLK